MDKAESIFDWVDDDARAAAVAEADAALARGESVDHDQVMDWLAAMARGERPPAPGRKRSGP